MYRLVDDPDQLCFDCADAYSCALCGEAPLTHAVDVINFDTAEGRFLCLSCAGDNENNLFTCAKCDVTTFKTLDQYAQNDTLCVHCAPKCTNCNNLNFRIDKDLCYTCEKKLTLGYPADWVKCPMPGCNNFMHAESLMCDTCLNEINEN